MIHSIAPFPGLYVGPSKLGGRGLFAGSAIPRGTLITSASLLLVPLEDTDRVRDSHLHNYVFDWTPDATTSQYAVAFGEISFCNHSVQPNCIFELDRERLCVCLYAGRDVEPGEELTIDYDYDHFPFDIVEG
jgi:SET domain-containing protein